MSFTISLLAYLNANEILSLLVLTTMFWIYHSWHPVAIISSSQPWAIILHQHLPREDRHFIAFLSFVHFLVPYRTPWLENENCKLNYYVTQFPTGHGCFRKYLHRFGCDSSPTCPNCVDDEDAEDILTCCPGETSLVPNRVMEKVLNSRILWRQYSKKMAEIMIELRRFDERRRNLI